MRIYLTNCIKIEEPTDVVRKFVKKELTFKNPEIEKRRRMGFYVYGMNKTVKLYNEYEGNLYTPIGFFNKLFNIHPHKEDYIDCTTQKKVKIDSDITLRNYQTFGVDAIKKYYNGLFVLPCGLGKTELALECASQLGQKTIWLTHTRDLANQARERCEGKMHCKTSMVTDGVCDISGDIVFCTIQTLIKFIEREEIPQNAFGFLIADECHRVASSPDTIQMFRTCIDYFSASYKLGLTATLHRADGLEKCITEIIGDVIYEVKKHGSEYNCMYEGKCLLKVPVAKFQVPAKIHFIRTNYDIADKPVYSKNGGTIVYASLISNLSLDEDRNNIILSKLKSLKGSTIVLSDRVEQLKYLASKIDNSVQIDGSTPKKIREQALDDVRCGNKKVLLASYQLAKEGLDAPILENLVMASPVKDFAIVTQSIGRIQRPFDNKKEANVYDFLDNVGMLYGFYAKRRSTYIKNGWKTCDY